MRVLSPTVLLDDRLAHQNINSVIGNHMDELNVMQELLVFASEKHNGGHEEDQQLKAGGCQALDPGCPEEGG